MRTIRRTGWGLVLAGLTLGIAGAIDDSMGLVNGTDLAALVFIGAGLVLLERVGGLR